MREKLKKLMGKNKSAFLVEPLEGRAVYAYDLTGDASSWKLVYSPPVEILSDNLWDTDGKVQRWPLELLVAALDSETQEMALGDLYEMAKELTAEGEMTRDQIAAELVSWVKPDAAEQERREKEGDIAFVYDGDDVPLYVTAKDIDLVINGADEPPVHMTHVNYPGQVPAAPFLVVNARDVIKDVPNITGEPMTTERSYLRSLYQILLLAPKVNRNALLEEFFAAHEPSPPPDVYGVCALCHTSRSNWFAIESATDDTKSKNDAATAMIRIQCSLTGIQSLLNGMKGVRKR